jgi:putative oxidoreductase
MTSSNLEARLQAHGIAILRIALGSIFVAHGLQKLLAFGWAGTAAGFGQAGLPFPELSAALVIATELLGGAALALGLYTRLVALPLAVVMLVATLVVHLPAGFFLPQGMEFTLLMLAGTLALILTGPGALALDGVLARSPESVVLGLLERPRPKIKAAA